MNSKKSLLRRHYEEVGSTGEVNRLGEFVSSDIAEVHDNARNPVGPEGHTENP